MKHLLLIHASVVFTLLSAIGNLCGQVSAFTYEGRLTDGPGPANGFYELRFALYDALAGGTVVSGPVTNPSVIVTNGLFTVLIDFGTAPFAGADRWLEIGVRTNGISDPFTILSPRQPLTPVPYALYALASGSVSWSNISNVPPELADGVDNDTTYSAGNGLELIGTQFRVRFGGTGSLGTAARTDHNHDTNYWKLTGNSGTTVGVNFIGTTDNQPLEFRVNNQRTLRLESTGRLIGGSGHNVSTNASYSVIAGGQSNTNQSHHSSVAGGFHNSIGTNSPYSTIGAGGENNIGADSAYCTVAGGSRNEIGTNSLYSVVGGGRINTIGPNSLRCTLAGGTLNDIEANADASVIGGGYDNNIAANSQYSTIAGGYSNDIDADSVYSTISGGWQNDIGTNSEYSVISGGLNNNIAPNAPFSAVAGGQLNDIGTNSEASTISGGYDNNIADNSNYCTVGGGQLNDIGMNSAYSVIGGGFNNNIAENATYGTIPGGDGNFATNRAFAAGHRAKANHSGAFVWGDSVDADVVSTNVNSMTLRATGGYRLVTALTGAGVYLASGTGSWTSLSDRNAKENFAPVDVRGVLEKVAVLPVCTWNYKTQTNSVRHIGPTAQDFKAAFGLGEGDTGITTIDADGVALAAIKGLNEKFEGRERELQTELKSKSAHIEALQKHNELLEQRVAKLERLLTALNGEPR
jgi:hypothetical protein